MTPREGEEPLKILLVHNPQAGGGRGRKMLPKIEGRFRSLGSDVELRLTERAGHGITVAEEADLSRFDAIVASGGDGTVYEVVTGYYRNRGKAKPPLGIVPCGTGNAFVREMGFFGPDWEEAIETVLQGEIRAVDVARFTTGGEIHYSLNILGVGFVSDVSETAVRLKFLGNNAYLLGVFYRLLKLRFHPLRITFDGHKESVEALFATVSNSRYTGTAFLMAPEAKIDDGLLDLVVVKRISRFRILRIFKTIFTGAHIREPEVVFHQARKITIETDEERALNVDGEVLGRTPIQIECLPRDLKLFWPCNS